MTWESNQSDAGPVTNDPDTVNERPFAGCFAHCHGLQYVAVGKLVVVGSPSTRRKAIPEVHAVDRISDLPCLIVWIDRAGFTHWANHARGARQQRADSSMC